MTQLRYQTHIGLCVETAGWGVNATAPMYWLPYTKAEFKDNIKLFKDAGYRGLPGAVFNASPGQMQSDHSVTADVFADALPWLLGEGMVGGSDVVTTTFWSSTRVGPGAGTTSAHLFTTNPPKSICWFDYNAVSERQYQGSRISQLDIKYANAGQLEMDIKSVGRLSVTGQTSVVVVPTVQPMMVWQASVLWNNSTYLRLIDCNLTFKRGVEPLFTQALTQSPTNVYAFPLMVTGKMSLDFQDESEYAYYSATNNSVTLDIWFFANTANAFRFVIPNPAYESFVVNRGKDALVVDMDFESLFNTNAPSNTGIGANVNFYVYNARTLAYP